MAADSTAEPDRTDRATISRSSVIWARREMLVVHVAKLRYESQSDGNAYDPSAD